MGGSNLYRSTAMPLDCLIQHAGFGPFTVSEWDLSPEHSLMLPVQPQLLANLLFTCGKCHAMNHTI